MYIYTSSLSQVLFSILISIFPKRSLLSMYINLSFKNIFFSNITLAVKIELFLKQKPLSFWHWPNIPAPAMETGMWNLTGSCRDKLGQTSRKPELIIIIINKQGFLESFGFRPKQVFICFPWVSFVHEFRSSKTQQRPWVVFSAFEGYIYIRMYVSV